jgi:hypothetical protein
VRLEGLNQLKNPITSSEIETATFRLVVPQPTESYKTPKYTLQAKKAEFLSC